MYCSVHRICFLFFSPVLSLPTKVTKEFSLLLYGREKYHQIKAISHGIIQKQRHNVKLKKTTTKLASVSAAEAAISWEKHEGMDIRTTHGGPPRYSCSCLNLNPKLRYFSRKTAAFQTRDGMSFCQIFLCNYIKKYIIIFKIIIKKFFIINKII